MSVIITELCDVNVFSVIKFRGALVAVHFRTLNFTKQIPNVGSLMGSSSTYSRVFFCVNADKNVQSEFVFSSMHICR